MTGADLPGQSIHRPTPIAILGVPFDKITTEETVELVARMIASRAPHYLATANVNFAASAFRDVELRRILLEADCVLCDGMPLVWASRWLGNPLPERVTGADLVPRLLEESERRGWRVFFLGGSEESLGGATANMRARHPKLQISGAYSPPFRPLLEMNHEDILRRIADAKPDILFVAFGCPKQEKWIKMNYLRSGVPVSIGVGASIDFLAGLQKRAPVMIQRIGLEWLYRICQEPRRLLGRYARDLWIFGFAIAKQWWRLRSRPKSIGVPSDLSERTAVGAAIQLLKAPPRLDVNAVENDTSISQGLLASGCHIIVDMSAVEHIDSTGAGWLEWLQKKPKRGPATNGSSRCPCGGSHRSRYDAPQRDDAGSSNVPGGAKNDRPAAFGAPRRSGIESGPNRAGMAWRNHRQHRG